MTPRWKRALQIVAWLFVLVLLAVLVSASSDMRKLLVEAVHEVNAMAVLVMLPGQLVSVTLCALALRAFSPGISFMGCAASRLLRDAAGNLPVVPPGTGEAIGARVLVLAGGGTRQAIVASTLDKLAETLAQIPYIALAAWLLFSGWNPQWRGQFRPVWVLGAMLTVLLVLFVWRRFASKSPLSIRLREEWAKLAEEARAQRSGMPLSLILHFLGWLMGGLQLWLAGMALGLDIGPFEAIAIESAAYAGRAILFFVPAGLVAQEAGLVAAGLVFALAPAQSLALGLAMRMRDLAFGIPLLIWPMVEMRRQHSA